MAARPYGRTPWQVLVDWAIKYADLDSEAPQEEWTKVRLGLRVAALRYARAEKPRDPRKPSERRKPAEETRNE